MVVDLFWGVVGGGGYFWVVVGGGRLFWVVVNGCMYFVGGGVW